MSKMETKPTTPSVIARLMGLDSLPNQQPVKKQKLQRVLSENYRRKVASIGVREKRSFDERRSYRFNIGDQKEFKDVYEVIDSLQKDKESDLLAEKGRLDLGLSQGKVPFSFGSLDAEHVPVSIKLKPSEEVHSGQSGPGFVDSRNHFQKAGYLTTKHFYDEDSATSDLQSEHVRILETSNAFSSEKIEINRKHALDGTYAFPRFRPEANNEKRPSFRKIVVLKPKPGKSENATNCLSSLSTSEGCDSGNRSDKRFLSHGKGNLHAQVKERTGVSNDMKFSGHRSIISCETEKEITQKTKHNMNDIPLEPPRSGFSGFHCLAKEPQFMMHSSPNYSDLKNRFKSSYYYYNGSYVAREAKKQISERCRIAKEFRENGLATEGSCKRTTLGEMLAFPDYEKHAESRTPLGISSKDGWNNRVVGDLIKSISPVCDDSLMTTRPLFSLNWSRMKSNELSSSEKGGLEQSDSGSNCMKSPSSPRLESEKNHVLEDKYVIYEMFKNNLEKQDPSEQNSVLPKSLEHCVVYNDSESKITQTERNDIMHGNVSPEASSKKEYMPMEISEDCSTDLESLVKLETAYQPSPVSVLDSPFGEDTLSGSECFLNVSASLHDVRRQLEFLKSESYEGYSEGPGMVVSSDDDAGNESQEDCEVNEDSTKFGVEDSREFSYVVDVLTEAGFHSKNQDKGFDEWHSPECPISPSVFEILEKKYGEQTSWKRSEKRLLFDRVNSGLKEILQPCLGEPMWAKPVARRFTFSQNLKVIEKELYTFLVSQEKEAGKHSSEKALAKDDGWLFLGYEIEEISREIENSLVDELAEEIVCIESF